MRMWLYRSMIFAICISLMSGCMGGATSRLYDTGSLNVSEPTILTLSEASTVERSPGVGSREQPAKRLETIGQLGGQMNGIAVQGDYAYVGIGPRLQVLDIVNRTSPVLIGQTSLLPDLVRYIEVDGDFAYVTTAGGELRIIDISDATTPLDVTVADTRDATDNSVAARSVADDLASEVQVVENYAYVVTDRGLQIVDMAEGDSPAVVGTFELQQPAEHLDVADGHVYIAAGQSGLKIIDVADPTQPVEVGVYAALDAVTDVQVKDNVAYVIDPWSGLHLIDVENPTVPVEIAQYDTPGLAGNVTVAENRAFVIDHQAGLLVIDVADATAPVLQSVYRMPQVVEAVLTTEDQQVAYVAAGVDGLWIVDLADPAAPVAVGKVELSGSTIGLAAVDDYLYVAAGESGLYVLDISDPLAPNEVGNYATLGYASDVDAAGSIVYIADEWSGLHVVDMSTPARPVPIASFEMGMARDVDVAGDYVYLAADEDDLYVFDVSDPHMPLQIDAYNIPGDANGVAINGDYAYLAAGGAGLQVVNLGDVEEAVVGEWAEEYAQDVYTAGQYVYLTTEQAGLQVINLETPTVPARSEIFETAGSATRIYGSDGYIFVADGIGGMLIFKINP